MSIRFAVAGFRHFHILDLINGVGATDGMEVVATCEEDARTRETVTSEGRAEITHDSFERMLDEVECEAVAIGDYYGRRGSLAIAALKAGKNVIADKPICTSLDELDEIAELARAGNLSVSCQLDLRGNGGLKRAREIIASGEIGEVHTVTVTGQHPLMYGKRQAWYFEPGCHGGTINDIAIHVTDFIPWLTGREVDKIVAARVWNAKATQARHFKDCGQFMLQLDNGGGVLGDVSYLAPDGCGYSAPNYWRVTCHGLSGMVETVCHSDEVLVASDADKAFRSVPAAERQTWLYLKDFADELNGRQPRDSALTTQAVLKASRLALQIQQVADGA